MSRLLFITSNRIGDAVLSTAALEEALRRLPDAKVTIAAGPLALPIFRATPGLERLITIEKTKGRWRRLWGQLRNQRYDLAIDLRGSLVTSFLAARQRIVHKKSRDVRHKVAELAALMGATGAFAPRLRLDAEARDAATAFAAKGDRILAFGAGSNFIGKCWPAERFAEIGRRLAGLGAGGPMAGAKIVLLGGKGDREVNAEIRELLAGAFCEVVDATGKLDLLACAAVLERAQLFIGNDSGLMHLAATAGAPTIGLFGPSQEAVYGPFGTRSRAVRGPRTFAQIVAASGPLQYVDYSLMVDLHVDAVEEAARGMLAEAKEWAPTTT